MAKDEAEQKPAEDKKKKDKKKLVLLIVLVLAVAGGAYKFLLAPKPATAASKAAAAAAATAIPTGPAGAVVTLEPVNVNLQGGHYLKLGLSLQLDKAAGSTVPDGAFAMDSAIRAFTNQTVENLSIPQNVDKLKAKLLTNVEGYYGHHVMAVYFTSFVTQ